MINGTRKKAAIKEVREAKAKKDIYIQTQIYKIVLRFDIIPGDANKPDRLLCLLKKLFQ